MCCGRLVCVQGGVQAERPGSPRGSLVLAVPRPHHATPPQAGLIEGASPPRPCSSRDWEVVRKGSYSIGLRYGRQPAGRAGA